jgi:hypothetical protein
VPLKSFGAGGTDVYLIRTDAMGNLLWQRTYGGTSDDKAYSIQKISGGYIVAGMTKSFKPDFSDVYLIKIDANGNPYR